MTTPLDPLLQQFLAGGWTFITQLPKQKRSESLHLDFKEKKNASTGELHRDDREHLSIALSGFANAEGGLLVWGVEARRGEDGVDEAQRVVPIKQLSRFRSEIESVTPDLASFAVPGVEHRAIPMADGQDEGIVVTVIPKSDLAPHMATGKDLQSYHRRTDSRFQVLEHYEVADLFGRRPQPVLHVRPFWEMQCHADNRFRFVVQFMVENTGHGIAQFPCLTIGNPPKEWPLLSGTDTSSVGGPFRKVGAPFGWLLRYSGGADHVLYPGDRFTVAYVAFELSGSSDRSTFRMEYELVAQGCPAINGVVEEQFVHLAFIMQALHKGQTHKSPKHPDNDPPAHRT